MANSQLMFKVETNADALAKNVEEMTTHFAVAPDYDPAKVEMVAFGEIDIARHFSISVECIENVWRATLTPIPELQAIMDMVP